MTEKNRDRLRQFDDVANLRALFTLPQRIVARQNRRKHPTRADALEVQSALVVELLLFTLIRIGNLAGLDLEQHVLRTQGRGRGVVHLVIPAEQVKNGITIEAQLQSPVVKLLELYLDRYRPLLLSGASSSLFPNSSGGPKSRHTLAQQIKKFVRRECGLQVNVHLFRHFGAAHYLSDHPGDYGTMRLVLGHTSFDSTTRAYCGTETAAAMRQFDEHVLQLRAQLTSDCTPKAGRRSRRGVTTRAHARKG